MSHAFGSAMSIVQINVDVQLFKKISKPLQQEHNVDETLNISRKNARKLVNQDSILI